MVVDRLFRELRGELLGLVLLDLGKPDLVDPKLAERRHEMHPQDLSLVPHEIQFEKGSAALSREAQATVEVIAERMTRDEAFDCVHMAGEVAADESDALAAERVRVVHDHVVSRGVDAVRLDTSTALISSYGRPREVIPAERRVTFIVVLYAGRVPRREGFEWRSIYGVL